MSNRTRSARSRPAQPRVTDYYTRRKRSGPAGPKAWSPVHQEFVRVIEEAAGLSPRDPPAGPGDTPRDTPAGDPPAGGSPPKRRQLEEDTKKKTRKKLVLQEQVTSNESNE